MNERHKADPPAQNMDKLPHPSERNTSRVQAGMTCLHCDQNGLDYNGLLQLICPRCGVVEAGSST